MDKEISKTDRDIAAAMVRDARTLTEEDIEQAFASYRKRIDEERQKLESERFTDEDWQYIHNFYIIFFSEGFHYCRQRFDDCMAILSDLVDSSCNRSDGT